MIEATTMNNLNLQNVINDAIKDKKEYDEMIQRQLKRFLQKRAEKVYDIFERVYGDIFDIRSINELPGGIFFLSYYDKRTNDEKLIRKNLIQIINDEAEHTENKIIEDKIKIKMDEQNEEMIKKNKRSKYYQDNKEQLNIKRNEKFNCLCGGKYTLRNKKTHFKTKLHNHYLKSLENVDKLEI